MPSEADVQRAMAQNQSEKEFGAIKREQRKLDEINNMLLRRIMPELYSSDPEESGPTAYEKLSADCVRLREAMFDAGIGWDRLSDAVGGPEYVIDIAVEYFKGLNHAK